MRLCVRPFLFGFIRVRNRRCNRLAGWELFVWPLPPLSPELDCTFLGRKRAAEIIDSLFEKIKESLAKGEDVRIFGFGKFQVKFKWPERGETLKRVRHLSSTPEGQ